MRSKNSFAMMFFAVLVMVPLHARAAVTLELRPATQFVLAGQQTGVQIYAVANPPEPVGIAQIVLSWDPSSLTLTGSDSAGAHPWTTAGFPGGGLNTDFSDGDAFFAVQVSACSPATASPTGLLVTTLLFNATGSPGTSTVDILPAFGAFETKVWDNLFVFCSGVVVPSAVGQSANLTIISCSADAECDDGNGCTTDTCNVGVGVCQHVINFNDTLDCCNPATGILTPLDDGNECTGSVCDPVTGAVVHPPLPSGTPCGDPTNTTCSAPDSCDFGGNCVPNNATDGNFCEADGNLCTRDRCASGACVFVDNEPSGAPCDDGQDNCSPGQDFCLAGSCIGNGTDPCDAPGGFCLEVPEVGITCLVDGDCAGLPGSICQVDPADPNALVCIRPYTCGQCRPGMSDCPDDGDCFAPTCTADGFCVGFLENDLCQDSLHCNGAEICIPVGDPVVAGQCAPDPTPPCVGQSCREDTCCDGVTCSENLCACVACIVDADCNDGNACNGLELCDQLTFSCVPGAAVDCSHLNDQCMTGVCNPALPGPDLCEAVPDNEGFPCDDGVACTSVDTCLAGVCAGSFDESPNGTVDVQWDPTNLNQVYPAKNVGDTVRIDFWLAANDGDVCAISGDPCVTSADCPGICDDGFTPCNSAIDCASPQFCSIIQACAPSEHSLLTLQTVIEFDPTVLQLIGNEDPCVATPGDCVDCTTDADCTALGVSCFCPGGPPCGVQPGQARGVCRNGKYAWGASGFPSGGNDPDNLNSPDPDGQVLYLATARIGVIDPKPKAPVLSGEPLWVTTLEFLALDGAASTTVDFNLCTGVFPTRTRIIGDGAGNFITGDLGQASIRIRECTVDAECDDGIPCSIDTCDAQSQCQHAPNNASCDNGVFCDGVEICDVLTGCFSPGDPCVGQGQICVEPPGTCVECIQNSDCDDGIVCTDDSCANNVCLNLDTCPEDAVFCNGLEFCNLSTNLCDHTGDPCPGQCNELDHCPSCDPPLVESVGPRYIAITAQPIVNPTPTSFWVTSAEWPCLGKYVGTFAQCGGTGGICNTDADCNSCTLLGSACLSDADCKTCSGTTNPCQTAADCGGASCDSVQVCQLSGVTCQQASFFEEIDIDQDGMPDGILATLVDDPAKRASLTAEEWGTTTYTRCSHSQEPCVSDADCDIGACSVSGRGCSVGANDCRGLCVIAQTECSIDLECPTPGDACTGSQTCLPFETCQAGKIYLMSPDIVPTDIDKATGTVFPSSYSVQADCGSLSDPVTVVMRLWADADDNGLINIDDAFITLKGFQFQYPPAVPSKTLVAFDIDGSDCTPNQTVNIQDVFIVILAFQGDRFDLDVVGGGLNCSLPCP